ncbi:Uncharacterized membrane protein [Noviherbaspirillum humi]|uniref:Uncharacterized membrane protein n=1 Tax=Noviherbaspirillum humi TaxID=1688639 RepID=A0A239IIC1_9BURK|nr:DUF1003 domain-containing protein [Noviherbaspirillum humi]SNS93400.1 Uncharacterized membrane protein [Noviherbaspirillum humi]
MRLNSNDIALNLLGTPYELLDNHAKRVTSHIAKRTHLARIVFREDDAAPTLGQRAADAVASFGGSWTFIIIFAASLILWIALNSFILVRYDRIFDAYPYILLNLFLSMLAAIQAPIILMSQNRQAQRDRRDAEYDYEVNLKAELEIMLLHEKLDLLRDGQWGELLEMQKEQLKLLSDLISQRTTNQTGGGYHSPFP